MCNDIYNKYLECNCEVYQNTFQCNIARRCQPTDDLLLQGEPVVLPTQRSKIPPGLLCDRKRATRPVHGSCPKCQRKAAKAESLSREDKSSSSSSRTATAMLATPTKHRAKLTKSPSSGVSSSMSAPAGTPSPDSRALARVRDSFMRVTGQYRPSPSSSASPGRNPDKEEDTAGKAS